MAAPDRPAVTEEEMPEEMHDAIEELRAHALMDGHEGRLERASESNRIGKALESWWRTHAQPVANVAMTEELERILNYAEGAARFNTWSPPDSKLMVADCAAVRAQATAPKKLVKVRAVFNFMNRGVNAAKWEPALMKDALAELDAFERGGREGEGK